jgi:hypothetical protein
MIAMALLRCARIHKGRNAMKLKNLGYAALMIVSATAFVLGTAGSSEAAKKKAAAAPPPPPGPCFTAEKPVCATRGGMKFTYASACIAVKDGAKVVSDKACPVKAAKTAKKGGGKKAKKPAKAKEKK